MGRTNKKPRGKLFPAGAAALAITVAAFMIRTNAAESIAVSDLTRQTHIHGLAIDRQDPSRLLIATHHGLFSAGADGKAERVSPVQDFMGFTPHPSDPNRLYASGHPAQGGNLGFIASEDRGRTWTQVSPGANGPVDFHQMTVSPADPQTIYGTHRGLQVSRDAGKTWTIVGPGPEGLIDLAGSAKSRDTLYAATQSGLLVSTDAGRSWIPLAQGAPVSLVEVTPEGTLYAFVLGRGLVKAAEPPVGFETISSGFGDGYLLHLAADPTNPKRVFAATNGGKLLSSIDQGRTWTALDQPNL
ncbi:F510_1955 family glycosylhydrolase [Microvirga sp. Mcv34]|uniref:F510_1955 family glycosylhydrolase n=1 Tax=Microvirga sp. Mcv34 TaxID=2926016 RepID=UPI0021CA6CFB|nr:exo-alpha-sialidase [Microvirga sp. Mcv34]